MSVPRSIEKVARTIDEAVNQALKELGLTRNEVEIEVLEEPNRGLFGFFGPKEARVRATVVTNPAMVAEQFLKGVLGYFELEFEVRVVEENDKQLRAEIYGTDLGSIIGRRGETLDALQYLTALAVNRETGGYHKVAVEAGDYRQRRAEALQRLAERTAEKVISQGGRVALEPMNPVERRLIHIALQSHPDVVTQSEGEEPYRRVVVNLRPKEQ
ncbi:MAG: protein jag [Chloroflexi bacterium]|nr:protein jag [Chloroflexota bacterium]